MKGDAQLFNYETLDYDLGTAYFMALCSALAYKDAPQVLNQLGKWGYGKTASRFFDRKSMQAFVAANSKSIIVCYRGTDSIRDWIIDAQIRKTKGPWNSEVHSGFWNGFLDLWLDYPLEGFEGIQSYLMRLKSSHKFRNAGVWICGHSLGAALATLQAARMSVMGWPVWGVYTFGSPRCGNEIFEIAYDIKLKARTHRHVRNNDPVPRVPLRSWGYAHVGQLQYFTEEGDGPYDDPSWWFRALDRLWGRVEDLGEPGFDGAKDHSIDESYVPACKKALPTSWNGL